MSGLAARHVVVFLCGSIGTALDAFSNLDQIPKIALGLFAILLLGAILIYDVIDDRKSSQKILKTSDAYLARMCQFIDGDEPIAIVTRRLEWVRPGTAICLLLEKKAKLRELELFLIEPNAISIHFEKLGANVRYYRSTGYSPEFGFTLVGPSNNLRQVAIGWRVKSEDGKPAYRRLQFYSSSTDPAAEIARSVYEFLKKYGEPRPGGAP